MRSARQVGAVVVLALTVAGSLTAQAPPADEEFTAILSNISNVGATGLTPVTIKINRWTGVEEDARLLGVLRDEGQEAFLRALHGAKPVGWIATPASLRYEFFYATAIRNGEKGRRILLITDRPMAIWERMNGAQSRDYPFTVIELRVDPNGNGHGTLAQLVQLRLSGDILGIENLATAPMKLTEVKKVKR